ncbi:uncharacterized protein G2W53_003943 [Senna tora]|uniref:Uncharacterized protein n=1 Tax=Senna tora TaxID=362788 RepID=A0A834XAZ3_9FABA|nr:uncharacterized protein G2W53_003943 [Senna tora]
MIFMVLPPVMPTIEFTDSAIRVPVDSFNSSLASHSSASSSSSPSSTGLDRINTCRCLFLHLWVVLYFSSHVKHSPFVRFLDTSSSVTFLYRLLLVLAVLDAAPVFSPPFVFELRETIPNAFPFEEKETSRTTTVKKGVKEVEPGIFQFSKECRMAYLVMRKHLAHAIVEKQMESISTGMKDVWEANPVRPPKEG